MLLKGFELMGKRLISFYQGGNLNSQSTSIRYNLRRFYLGQKNNEDFQIHHRFRPVEAPSASLL